MTKYIEILRLTSLGFTQRNIVNSCKVSQKTVVKVQRRAKELNLSWPFEPSMTDAELEGLLFPKAPKATSTKRMPDFEYIRKELQRHGVSKKLLWTEYLEECRLSGDDPFRYSQFCYYIQQDEIKRCASMHINRKPGEQIEVDWAGDPAYVTDPDTGETIKAFIFVGVLSYSQYAYVEAFPDEKQASWIRAHINMYRYFGGVSRILVPDNCKTAVLRNSKHSEPEINEAYQELARHYGTAIIPARIRSPKDKPNAEGVVGNISTWITAAIRNEQFFSFDELNETIFRKLETFNDRPFQKKNSCRSELFFNEELPLLLPLPQKQFELAEWKKATVQFNYHVAVDGMMYSVPYEYLKHKVDIRVTDTTVEIFCNHTRIASHMRKMGRKGQYSTITEHMPEDHRQYLEWNGDRFRQWAKGIGENTFLAVDAMLNSRPVEQQAYRGCMSLLKLADKYSKARLERACEKALTYTSSPSYKSVKDILVNIKDEPSEEKPKMNPYGLTRGASYYGR